MVKGKSIFGIFLIFAGAFLLLERLNLIDGDLFMLLLGAAFIAAYFANQYSIGFLIPGSILTWLGVYSFLMEQPFWDAKDIHAGGLLFLALGLAFFTMFLHTLFKEKGAARFWPLYPGLGLILFAIIVEFEFNFIPEEYMGYIKTYWPGLIILTGVIVLLTSGKNKST